MATAKTKQIVVRALHTQQGDGLDVFAFFIKGTDIVQVADISRVERTENDNLKGFQRPEIRSHVKSIANYLNQGNVLFPNSIILAQLPWQQDTAGLWQEFVDQTCRERFCLIN